MSLIPEAETPRSRHATQLDRIEAKLDRLIAVLSEEDDAHGESEWRRDLDGAPLPAERNATEEL